MPRVGMLEFKTNHEGRTIRLHPRTLFERLETVSGDRVEDKNKLKQLARYFKQLDQNSIQGLVYEDDNFLTVAIMNYRDGMQDVIRTLSRRGVGLQAKTQQFLDNPNNNNARDINSLLTDDYEQPPRQVERQLAVVQEPALTRDQKLKKDLEGYDELLERGEHVRQQYEIKLNELSEKLAGVIDAVSDLKGKKAAAEAELKEREKMRVELEHLKKKRNHIEGNIDILEKWLGRESASQQGALALLVISNSPIREPQSPITSTRSNLK